MSGTELIVTPHPIACHGQRRYALADPGQTLAQVLQGHGVALQAGWVVEVGGAVVPEQHWGRVRVKHGQLIEARHAAGRDVARVVLTIAVLYVAFLVAGGALAAYGLAKGAFVTTLVAGTIVAVGTGLVNRAFGPRLNNARGNSSDIPPSYNLSGIQNQARMYQPMALVFGQPWMAPDLGAQPFAWFSGEDQYLLGVFHFGLNVASIDQASLSIGDTLLSSYSDVSVKYNAEVARSSVDSISGGALTNAAGSTPANNWVTRRSSANAIGIQLDLDAQLYAIDDRGNFSSARLELEVEYNAVGTSAWLPWDGDGAVTVEVSPETWVSVWDDVNGDQSYTVPAVYKTGLFLHANNGKPVRKTLTLNKSFANGANVRMRKISADVSSTRGSNAVTWVSLKTIQQDTGSYEGEYRISAQIKASGQLSGGLDQVNAIALARPMPHWSGSAWVTASAAGAGLDNPGSIFLLLCRGIYSPAGQLLAGLGWADSRIDIESIKAFSVWCAARNFTLNWVCQENLSQEQMLAKVAAAGMGSVSRRQGKIGVQFFSPDQPISGVINMGNIKLRSFAASYALDDRADEIEFGYYDRNEKNAFESLRVTAPGVSVPTKTARLDMAGITTEAHASVLARRLMAENVYLSKTVEVEMDAEALTFERGSVVALSHDMTQWGYSGRLKSISEGATWLTLELDDFVPALGPAGQTLRTIGLRLAGETTYRILPVDAFTGTSRFVTVPKAWASPAQLALPAQEWLWVYDFKSVPGQKAWVTAIEPADDLGARLTLVPVPDEFWTYVFSGAYTPAPKTNLLNTVAVASNLRLREQLVDRSTSYLIADFDVRGPFQSAKVDLYTRTGAGSGAANLADFALASSTITQTSRAELLLQEQAGKDVKVIVTPINTLGKAGTQTEGVYVVQGWSAPPADVTTFTIEGQTLNWSAVPDLDLLGYEIRYSTDAAPDLPDFGLAQKIHSGFITEGPYLMPAIPGVGTLMIKAVDSGGRYSNVAATISYPGVLEGQYNAITTASQSTASWPGALTGGSRVGTSITASQTAALMWNPNPQRGMWSKPERRFYDLATYAAMSYRVSFAPSHLARSYITAEVSASSAYNLVYRSNASQDYQPWLGAILATPGAVYEFVLSTAYGPGQGKIDELTLTLSMPPQLEELDNITISAAGSRLPIASTWQSIERILLTVQSSGTGAISAAFIDKNPTSGPLVRCFDAAGASVGGIVDAQLKGY